MGAGAATWLARFDGLTLADNGGLGSCHTSDIPFAFDTIDQPALRHRLGPAPPAAAAATCTGRG